jgi:flavin reductase (DIM6/NTAB) family NADH-FMN oxidoreductase RutF
MSPEETYALLRALTSPVVAITSARGETHNGMISDAAIRASIVPDMPRVGVFIHKFNFSHDLIFETGRFALHILHEGQVALVERLGFASGREGPKLTGVPYRLGVTGCPVLADCWAWFDCRVCNAMDTGSSTFFLGDVVGTGRGPGRTPMAPAFLREALSERYRREYPARLAEAQERARRLSRDIRPLVWKDLAQSRT